MLHSRGDPFCSEELPIGVKGQWPNTLERLGATLLCPRVCLEHVWLIRDDRKGTRCGFNPVCMHTLHMKGVLTFFTAIVDQLWFVVRREPLCSPICRKSRRRLRRHGCPRIQKSLVPPVRIERR